MHTTDNQEPRRTLKKGLGPPTSTSSTRVSCQAQHQYRNTVQQSSNVLVCMICPILHTQIGSLLTACLNPPSALLPSAQVPKKRDLLIHSQASPLDSGTFSSSGILPSSYCSLLGSNTTFGTSHLTLNHACLAA